MLCTEQEEVSLSDYMTEKENPNLLAIIISFILF